MSINCIELVSVIVPAFNVDKYIKGTIESIKNQDYHDLEIIIVDDGSTDSTGVICDELALTDNRIQVIHQQNRGVSSARNCGLRKSSGKYITFIDADDAIKPNFVSVMIDAFHNNGVDIVSCSYKKAYSVEERDIEASLNTGEKNEFFVTGALGMLNDLLSHKISPSACERMYKSEIVADLFFLEDKKENEDKFFLFQSLRRASMVAFSDFAGYICLQRAFSASRNPMIVNFDAIEIAERIIRDFKSEENEGTHNIFLANLNYSLTLLYKAREIVRSKISKDEKKKLFFIVRSKIRNAPKCKLSLQNKIEKVIINLGWRVYSRVVTFFDALRK